MITISLWQPWASAIALGLKTYETRSWAAECPLGSRIAIHGAKRDTPETRTQWMDYVKRPAKPGWLADHCTQAREVFAAGGILDWCDMPLGFVVCTAELVAVHPTAALVERGAVSPLEALWGDYRPGRYAWELRNVERLATPAPAKGWQNFFTWDPATNETKGLPPAGRGRMAA